MKRPILSEYGPDRSAPKSSGNGGQMMPKPLPYDPPKGPTNQMRQGPGLGGANHGCCGTQGKR